MLDMEKEAPWISYVGNKAKGLGPAQVKQLVCIGVQGQGKRFDSSAAG